MWKTKKRVTSAAAGSLVVEISPISMQIVDGNSGNCTTPALCSLLSLCLVSKGTAAASGLRSPSFPMQYVLMAHHKSHVLCVCLFAAAPPALSNENAHWARPHDLFLCLSLRRTFIKERANQGKYSRAILSFFFIFEAMDGLCMSL